MELSGFLLKLSETALRAIIKTTNASIRTHDEHNVPDGPVVFVINHFTRIETMFLPYIIKKVTGRAPLSLAFHEFFAGGFGKLLNKLGAISTHEPDKNRIMTAELLTGGLPIIIYPEGQMIKDKKIIEKGKYMIYNAGIRRPPHTGAALLALRSQFYREKIRHFLRCGNTGAIEEYARHFGFSTGMMEKVAQQNTVIVPVNITYFPIRAKNNILNRLAKKFMDKVPERFEEEIQVEGTMLVEGVDIDINFGRPIETAPFLDSRKLRGLVRDEKLYIPDSEILAAVPLKKQAIRLMFHYMSSIYEMTTVNHDHVFSYLLTRYRRTVIRETDFRNRAFAAINKIRDIPLVSHHTNLMHRQGYLLTDDIHGRYASFIEAAESDGLISVKNGIITKNRDRFSGPREFHTIRRDNIVEVLRNEIEPMRRLTRTLDFVMLTPSALIRRSIRKYAIKSDGEMFQRDYAEHFREDESKPRNIGKPEMMKRFLRNRRGVLLVHGYLAAPEEVRNLGRYLRRHGYTVYLVRLRGHGTTPEDLAGRTWEQWYESVNRGYVALKNTVGKMAVVGFSTGAGLALYTGITKSENLVCAVSISAPLRLKNISSRFASTVVLWNSLLSKMRIKKGRYEFVENHPENPHINYFRNPIHGVNELEKMMQVVEYRLPDFKIPVLIVQASNDPVVNSESAFEIFRKMGPIRKEICLIHSDRHGIVNGEESTTVFRRVKNFLDERFDEAENPG
jgi:esterase/lipase/1-acyl-sn-glycerol-3-phosphate acyltransferase